MANFITFQNVKDFFEKTKNGESLPDTWEEDFLDYLKRKEIAISKLNLEGKDQLEIAKRIFKYIKAKHGTTK